MTQHRFADWAVLHGRLAHSNRDMLVEETIARSDDPATSTLSLRVSLLAGKSVRTQPRLFSSVLHRCKTVLGDGGIPDGQVLQVPGVSRNRPACTPATFRWDDPLSDGGSPRSPPDLWRPESLETARYDQNDRTERVWEPAISGIQIQEYVHVVLTTSPAFRGGMTDSVLMCELAPSIRRSNPPTDYDCGRRLRLAVRT
ncbi:hypothetical protein VTO42DRAFT_1824 [Malbranchea cinnamomea]